MDKRGYRDTVRVIIRKGNQVLLGERKHDTRIVHSFPGGGIEYGETVEQAAIKECLEEVGVKIENVVKFGYEIKFPFAFQSPERDKKYKGVNNIWVMAEFVKVDKSEFDMEGDGFPYAWVSIEEAERRIKKDDPTTHTEQRLEAIATYKNFLKRNPVKAW